jgi:hypothetical protein
MQTKTWWYTFKTKNNNNNNSTYNTSERENFESIDILENNFGIATFCISNQHQSVLQSITTKSEQFSTFNKQYWIIWQLKKEFKWFGISFVEFILITFAWFYLESMHHKIFWFEWCNQFSSFDWHVFPKMETCQRSPERRTEANPMDKMQYKYRAIQLEHWSILKMCGVR